jgi:type IV pilus assembly protein PilM
MGLFGRKATTVGLDIGSGLIKLVAVSHASGGPVLTKVAFTSIGNDAIVEGEIMDPGIVAEAIKECMATAGVKTKHVVVAVGGRDVIVKKITMDRMQETDAREVIRWEAEQHVPFDMDNVELDFQILDPYGEGLQMTVLLVAAKRELVEHKLALLADVGLQPSIIDVDAFALHNAFEINYPEAMNGVVGLVNVGHENTNIYILDDGVPVLTRDIPVGTRRFREDLQRERGQSAEEAEKLLQGGGAGEIPEGFLQTRTEELAVGIERAGPPGELAGSSSPVAAPGSRGSAVRWVTGSKSRCSSPTRSRSCRWQKASSTLCRWTKWPRC